MTATASRVDPRRGLAWVGGPLPLLRPAFVAASNLMAMLIQHLLSFGIPFALVPLVLLTRRRDVMGGLVNRRGTTAAASAVAAVIMSLNAVLLWLTFAG